MLDSKTLEWLEKREIIKTSNGFYFCGHCQYYNPSHYDQYTGYCACDYIECPLVTYYRDTVEFEARVARCATIGLSKLNISDIPFKCIKKHSSIQELVLIAARLQVEKEMDRP